MGTAVFIAIVVIAILVMVGKQNTIKRLRAAYDAALRGTDKRKALEAGRAYYKALRGKQTLTIYDEQAITNDLMTMDNVYRERV